MTIFKKTIFSKVLLLMVLSSLVAGILVLGMSIGQEAKLIEQALIRENEQRARIAAKTIETGYFAKIWPFEVLKQIKESENILFWWVVKPDGEIYMADDVGLWGQKIEHSFSDTQKAKVGDSFFYKTDEKIKLIIQPLAIQEAGQSWALYLGVSLKSVAAARTKMILTSFGFFVLIIIFAFALSFYFSKGLTRPLGYLMQGIKKIGEGHLDYHIKVETQDEFGQLAQAFNAMTGRLAETGEKREKDLQELQRTAKILVRRDLALTEANERLIAMDKAKSEFIAIAAHQLRTPLSGVKWTLKMILDGDLGKITPEQKEFLERGYQTNERMIHLVNDLLNVARIEEGRFVYAVQEFYLENLIEEIIKGFAQDIKEKHSEVKFTKPEKKLPRIKADLEKIRLVLENLLDNAIRYTQAYGKIRINIEKENNQLKTSIQDNGVGIPREQQERVFGKFFRGNNIIKKDTQGTGLGLYIVKNIIEAHHGKVWFESELNKGTVIHFTLPI